ncbi:hypothetical protein AQI95_14525 [Streptomyces yokosukanensis]|uniref:Uncharacterized protein n=1 Tax=Streptomyces yokosukanensis TaxID=67386 RepID=A0A117Q372_9ACTN|nr:DUF6221 family protein [Streptomyces yokosukanensis]KUN06116.1 hypothetical protein AQI95_14525 [Streptomyces yokosukanensis]
MTPESLEGFLRARFEEEERVARDAIAGAPGAVWGVMADDIEQVLTSQDGGTTHTPLVQFGAEDPVRLLTHVARHDPARVLRELQAKRALSREHRTRDDGRCRTCREAEGPRSACTTLRLLAAPFAGHPGYDDSWRP